MEMLNDVRDRVQLKFENVLEQLQKDGKIPLSEQSARNLAINLEIGAFNKALHEFKAEPETNPSMFQAKYTRYALNMFAHVNPTSAMFTKDDTEEIRHRLIRKLASKEVSVKQCYNENMWDFYPEKGRIFKVKEPQKKEIAENKMYRCSRCKSHKIEMKEMQTRSADEPMTVFMTCGDCGKAWKM